MYKDKDKQKEAQREANKRYRDKLRHKREADAKAAGVIPVIPDSDVIPAVIPKPEQSGLEAAASLDPVTLDCFDMNKVIESISAHTTQKQNEQDAAQFTISDGSIVDNPDIPGMCATEAEAYAQLEEASFKHYTVWPSMYVDRLEPERLNWGRWMNSKELKNAGLKANRVSLPGDRDYDGCVEVAA